MSKLTPMMQQYLDIKKRNKDSILFFRLGDFYEMFFDDAIIASKELEITLTGRACGKEEKAPMCGVPYHSADSYIARLVKKGYKVAICEQVEDPSIAKGIVKRDVVRIITPGTITDSNILDDKSNNYLLSIFANNKGVGLSYVDITTGDLYSTEIKGEFNKIIPKIIDELGKINPNEIISNDFLFKNEFINIIEKKFNKNINNYHDWAFQYDNAEKIIKKQFKVATLSGFGMSDNEYSIKATGALLEYIYETQKVSLAHINNIIPYSIENYMILDFNSRRNLELTETIKDNSRKGSLLWLLDKTSTAMGGRLLKKWIEEPLVQKNLIQDRLDTIEYLINDIKIIDDIKLLLNEVYDLERLVSKVSYGSSNARDLIALKNSLFVIPKIKKILEMTNCKSLKRLSQNIDSLEYIYELIEKSIVDDPPISVKDGGIIKKTYNKELSELIEAASSGKLWLSRLEENERKKTGIKSLKIGYNKVFGYFIEVTKSNLNLVPNYFIRKQTLSNSERYITPELKEMEMKILGAEEKSMKLEFEIFQSIRTEIKKHILKIQRTAKSIAQLDAINSLALVSLRNNYTKPSLNNKDVLKIINGRHPVVEKMMKDELFVPNDTYLDNKDDRLAIITGPNMAGKSTYMRQVALITLMAHIGCYVPADEANICIIDRIFTRVGASDDLSQGKSTFMVEMSEVANILNNSTSKSLLILDEIGRGTSTYDGLSIAWSVIEYISDKIGAKTLFATHYHELTELEGKLEGVKNYYITVKEDGEDIVFLRKIAKGSINRSYGIEVAKLAGVPKEVIYRAKEILYELEHKNQDKEVLKEVAISNDSYCQLNIFNKVDNNNLVDKLLNIDLINTTPLKAINILHSLILEAKQIRGVNNE